MKKLHTTDIVAGDGQIMRQQMVENFEIIQQVLNDIDSRLAKIEKKKQVDDDFMKHLYD